MPAKKVAVPVENMACTITFCESAENHVGMEQIGQKATAGLSLENFLAAAETFASIGVHTEIIDLIAAAGLDPMRSSLTPAYVIVIRGGARGLLSTGSGSGYNEDDLFGEQIALAPEFDRKGYSRRHVGNLVNQHARYNLCFADRSQLAGYKVREQLTTQAEIDAFPVSELQKGTIIDFARLPLLSQIRAKLPTIFGPSCAKLNAEGNYYYDPDKCYIGWHGDAERKIVVAVRMGTPIPLFYQWFHRFKPIGQKITINLNHGDMYAMSEKAVGTDWRSSKIPTLRHAAGPEHLVPLTVRDE